MLKKVFLLILVLLLCGSLTIFAIADGQSMQMIDEADLLTVTQEVALLEKLESISQAYGAQISVATVASLDGEDIDSAVETLYDQGGYGYGEDKAGVLLLIAMDVQEFRIFSNGFAASAITAKNIEWINEQIKPDLSAGDYVTAFGTFADECDYYLNGHINGQPRNPVRTLLILAPIGFIIALIAVLVMKGRLNSIREEERANAYIKDGSIQPAQANDMYLYRNITTTMAQQSTVPSDSGSTQNTGGGNF